MQGSIARTGLPIQTAFRLKCLNRQPRRQINQCRPCSSLSNDVSVEPSTDGSTMYRFGVPQVQINQQEDTPQQPKDTPTSQEQQQKPQQRFRSSWSAKEATGGSSPEADYLYEVGQSDLSMNVDTAQNSTNLDSVFTGSFLGHKSDIADGSLRGYEFRKFENLVGDYYVAPRFLEAVVMHIAKNFLVDQGSFDDATRVPLILGIWGGKGQGKSFQTELAFKKLGVEAIVMSAGELESDRAGEPGRLIRDRYRRAAELSRVRGRLSCLLINDLDAGIGRFDNTQHTVNNQMVVGSLMSICDDPNRVTLFNSEWNEDERRLPRIPIIVTGNDLSTVFAPLVRDGRMNKFFWAPSRDDLMNICHQMYKDDGLTTDDMFALLDTFPNQSLDFFGAIRAASYDGQIREWIKKDVVMGDISEDNENMKELGKRLVRKERLPKFEPLQLTRDALLKEGARLVREQEMVSSMKLSAEYYSKPVTNMGGSLIGLSG